MTNIVLFNHVAFHCCDTLMDLVRIQQQWLWWAMRSIGDLLVMYGSQPVIAVQTCSSRGIWRPWSRSWDAGQASSTCAFSSPRGGAGGANPWPEASWLLWNVSGIVSVSCMEDLLCQSQDIKPHKTLFSLMSHRKHGLMQHRRWSPRPGNYRLSVLAW